MYQRYSPTGSTGIQVPTLVCLSEQAPGTMCIMVTHVIAYRATVVASDVVTVKNN